MSGMKVKASECAVIVEDVLIKEFWEGFRGGYNLWSAN